ncbi:DNA replication and repair protein RecF [Xylophilus ampelinus]|nr:DNA replication and repair protein RecF [Xylophilus ampelinus]|tara:strand:+ start:512 stop:2188 length:1677 start_codon:yes stop_codon:yes gene_type:complete
MQLITAIQIAKFRSIDNLNLPEIGDFSVFAGLNNSGKSNILRALYLFFSNEVEPNVPLNFATDFHRRDLSSKKRKRISVQITFALPPSFKFRKGLESTEQLLTRNFSLKKEWGPEDSAPEYFLNDSNTPASLEDGRKIENFLRLVSVRYIPNRVVPTELISREHQALRDVLVRRLSKLQGPSTQLFDAIKQTSKDLLVDLSKQMQQASPDLETVSLSTADGLADLAFKFGYQLLEGGAYTSEHEQGSGIQSLLMFRTLSLIDQDYFKQFGWKQASLWLVEEPESSLHTSLEAQVAYFLRNLSTRPDGRLQAIASTHSDLQIQYSTKSYLVSKKLAAKNQISTTADLLPQRELLKKAAKFGVTRWVDPILFHPLEHVVLVEGKYDKDFIDACNKILGILPKYRVFTLEELEEDQSKGGIDSLIQYVKSRAEIIKSRNVSAGVFLLADWDAAKKESTFQNIFKGSDPFKFLAWDAKEANPLLDTTFRGIERFMHDRIIDAANNACGMPAGTKASGVRMISSEDFGRFKKSANAIVNGGVQGDDAEYATPMLLRLSALTSA